MSRIEVSDLQKFTEEELGLRSGIEALRDGRRRPWIGAPTVFRATLYGTVLGVESLLALDQWLKQADLGGVLGVDRAPLVSDSTMIRSLSTMDPNAVRALLAVAAHAALRLAQREGEPLRLGRWRVVAIDMTHLAGRPAVVARFVGPRFEATLDYEMVQEGENEVTAAKRLLPRVVGVFGALFDLLVVDGLYTAWFIHLGRAHGKHVVVKSREDPKNLVVLRRAQEWIEVHQWYGAGQPVKWADEDGYKTYEAIDTGAQSDPQLEEPVRVIRMREERPKGKKEKEECWLITTLERKEASVPEVRQIARRRWGIENGAFRTISQNHHGKRRGTQEGQAAEVRVGILLLGEMILRVYTWWREVTWKSPRGKRVSWQSVQKRLRASVPEVKTIRGRRPLGRPYWGLHDLREATTRRTGSS